MDNPVDSQLYNDHLDPGLNVEYFRLFLCHFALVGYKSLCHWSWRSVLLFLPLEQSILYVLFRPCYLRMITQKAS